MLVIEREGIKLSLKFYTFSRFRKAGVSWFKIHKDMSFLTVDTEKGDFYYGELKNYHLKTKCRKKFNKNFFRYNPIKNLVYSMVSSLREDENKVQEIIQAIKMFLSLLDKDFLSKDYSENRLLKFYLEKKKIKYPNNFPIFYFNQSKQPTLKDLRKSNMKLIDTFMNVHNLKGDNIKKVLHSIQEGTELNVTNLNNSLKAFPESWILQEQELIKKILTTSSMFSSYVTEQIVLAKKIMSSKELRNVFTCFREHYIGTEFSLNSFGDHLEFYNYLVRVGEKIKWKAKNWSDFKNEHLDWADKYDHYKRGYYTRIYPQSLDHNFRIPFISGDDVYYPIILKTSDEYNEESQTQSNCVKSYIGRPSSIIISIRKNSTISKERATVEYQIFKENDKVKFNRPQSLGTYNSRLDETWTPILKQADERMKTWIDSSSNFVTVKIEKNLEKFDRKLFSDSDWAENGFLFWTYFLISKESFNNPMNFNNVLDLI
jgi:hypothetical protein